jgi:hypothetical protein
LKCPSIALLILFFVSNAKSSIPQIHEAKCMSSEVLAEIGPDGSCRAVIIPKKVEGEGRCEGLLIGTQECALSYSVTQENANINLACGRDLANADLSLDMASLSFGHNVILLLKKSDGSYQVKADPHEYLVVYNDMIELRILSKTKAEVRTKFLDNPVSVSNVICQ